METTRIEIQAERREIAYLRYTLESYDGMAVVSTLDPHEARLEISVSPGSEALVAEILESLAKEEGLHLEVIWPNLSERGSSFRE